MTVTELRALYLAFFKQRGHRYIPSSSLVPKEDPTVLFTPAGMHPLVPYLLGMPHPQGTRVVNSQKCIRTSDIDEVGDSSHLTFFEMLGNWSFGDYWKQESITWSWEFLTSKDYLAITPHKLFVTIFKGEGIIPRDDESYDIWASLFNEHGISLEKRIIELGTYDNFWGPVGDTGPCGPDTEIFYDTGNKECCPECAPGCACGKYVEIWNNVFMEFEKTREGTYTPLTQKNVDTGMGAERVAALLSGEDSVYMSDVFAPLMTILGGSDTKERIIADHIKASFFIMVDGVLPSNKAQGYVVRRLLRRAFMLMDSLNYPQNTLSKLTHAIVDIYMNTYPETKERHDEVLHAMEDERSKFQKTLSIGLKIFNSYIPEKHISGEQAFELFATYGFPLELTQSLAKEHTITVDSEGFHKEYESHQAISRQGIDHVFKGGLSDQSEMSTKYHTATHLLLAGLRSRLGNDVMQKGSNITQERLRFDFNHPTKLTDDELREVEEFVNDAITLDLQVTKEELPLKEAYVKGVIGAFGEKYGDVVSVYSIGDVSKELCGGPHVTHTGDLGVFKIIKEESVSAGVRRIKAILT